MNNMEFYEFIRRSLPESERRTFDNMLLGVLADVLTEQQWSRAVLHAKEYANRYVARAASVTEVPDALAEAQK